MTKVYYNNKDLVELVGYKFEDGFLYGPSGKKLKSKDGKVSITVEDKRKVVKLTELVPETSLCTDGGQTPVFTGAPVKQLVDLWVGDLVNDHITISDPNSSGLAFKGDTISNLPFNEYVGVGFEVKVNGAGVAVANVEDTEPTVNTPTKEGNIWDASVYDLETLGVANSDILFEAAPESFTQFMRDSWYSVEHNEEVGDPRLLATTFAFLVDRRINTIIKTNNVSLMKKLITLAAIYYSRNGYSGQTVLSSFVEGEIQLEKIVAQAKKINYPYCAGNIRTFGTTSLTEERYELRARSMSYQNNFITDLSKAEHPNIIANSVIARTSSEAGVRIYGWDGSVEIPNSIEENQNYKLMDFRVLLDLGDKALNKLTQSTDSLILDLTGAEDLIGTIEEEFESSLEWYTGSPVLNSAIDLYERLPLEFKERINGVVLRDMKKDGLPDRMVTESAIKAYTVRHLIERLLYPPALEPERIHPSVADTTFDMLGAVDTKVIGYIISGTTCLNEYRKVLERLVTILVPDIIFTEEMSVANIIQAVKLLGVNQR